MTVFYFIICIIVSYFVGNISWARILSSLKKGDITKSGSGNPGTMNMLRTYGFSYALLTMILDFAKGALPALGGYLIFGGSSGLPFSNIALYSCGFASVIGHVWPVVYKFKGGKGVACAIGMFLVSNPLWVLILFVVAFVYVLLFDYGSVGSLLMITALTVIEGLNPVNRGNIVISCLLFAIFCLIVFLHRKNIARLFVGKENKANLQKSLAKMQKKRDKQKLKTIIKQNKIEYKQEKKEIKEEQKKKKNNEDEQ